MPVDTRHAQYKARVDQWTRCRDVVEGSDAVKSKSIKYLPKLGGQTDIEYIAYKRRALFFSVAGRSLSGLVGMMTRKPPIIDKPDDLTPFFDDATGSRYSFYEVFRDATNELLMVGRYGLLIDWPAEGGQPYLSTYVTENILNWFVKNDVLVGVVLREYYMTSDPRDQFSQIETVRYRHLQLINGIYYQSVYDDKLALYTPPHAVLVRGSPLTEIPFYIVNPNGISVDPVKPPILDIVDINLSMYINSADLEHGRHFTALPTPVVTGAPSDSVLKIGSQTAWIIPNEKAKAYYLEFLGSGLNTLENAIKEKTSHMAQFSARLMDTSTRGSEAAETVKLRHSSEATTLTGVAVALENVFNKIYKSIAKYIGLDENSVNISLNKDFLSTQLSAAELRELTKAYLEGAIDEETYFYNLERGELTPETKRLFQTFKSTEPKPGTPTASTGTTTP